MHAWILNGLTLFSFHTSGIIHVSLCMLMDFKCLACIPFILLDLFMPLNACLVF